MARKLLRWAEEMEAQMLPQQLSAAAGIACGRGDLSTSLEMTTGEGLGMTAGEVRGFLAEKCAAGYGVQVQGIIRAFGAEKFSEVDPADYPAVMRAASLLGAEGGDADAG